MGIATISVALLAACSGGSSVESTADEVRSIRRADAEVFMDLNASDAEVKAVRAEIERSDVVRTFAFVSKHDAMRSFRQLFADQPALIATTTAEELPVSFVLRFVKGEDSVAFVRQVSRRTGVDEVKDRHKNTGMPRREVERICAARPGAGPGDVEVYLFMDATTVETDAVQATLETAPAVQSFRFLSRDAALTEFQRIFAHKPKLLESTTADQLPTSFRLDLATGQPVDELLQQLAHMPGVEEVSVKATEAECAVLLGGPF